MSSTPVIKYGLIRVSSLYRPSPKLFNYHPLHSCSKMLLSFVKLANKCPIVAHQYRGGFFTSFSRTGSKAHSSPSWYKNIKYLWMLFLLQDYWLATYSWPDKTPWWVKPLPLPLPGADPLQEESVHSTVSTSPCWLLGAAQQPPVPMSVCQRLTDVSHAHNSSEGKSHPLSDWLKGQSTFSVCTWQIWISCRDEISPRVQWVKSAHRDLSCRINMVSTNAKFLLHEAP